MKLPRHSDLCVIVRQLSSGQAHAVGADQRAGQSSDAP